MIPENIFVDTPETSDVSMHQLSNNVEEWPEEIIQKLRERIPQTSGVHPLVKFMKKDPENGVATGAVILNSSDKAALVPLIIKDFMLYPLDVFVAKQKLLPLTPEYFLKVFQSNGPFDSIEEFPTFSGLGRFEGENLWNTIYPPSLGRYAYASAGYPILDEISDTIDGSELKAFLADPANEKTAARFIKSAHWEVLKKLAHLQPVNMNEFRQGVDKLIPRSVAMVRRDGPDRYSILSNADSVFHPGIMRCNRVELIDKFISKLSDHAADDVNDIDQNGEKVLMSPAPRNEVFLTQPVQEVPESADDYDHYFVKTKSGIGVEGVVIPRVINFDQKFVKLKIFLGKGMSTIQPEVWGVRIKNSHWSPKHGVPQVGQTGTFVYQPDKSHALATIPVTIKSIVNDGADIRIKAFDLNGVAYNLKLSPASEKLTAIAKLGDGYILPSKMKWIAMDEFPEVTNSAADYAVKTASMHSGRSVTLIPTGYGRYAMKGVNKYASRCDWDHTNLDGYQAKFLLLSLGMPEEKIASAMAHASQTGKADIYGLNFVPLLEEKVAKAKPLADYLRKEAAKFKVNLIKEASFVENSQTVDTMLSLNFVSPDNVAKFVGKLPQLKSTVSHLASCVLASRLGIKEIPEQSAASAMTRLLDVINGLERLRATQEIAG